MRKYISILLALSAMAAGCNNQPHPGIEAGNPNISVKSMRILPKDGDEQYEVLLLDETTADVSQIESGSDLKLLDEVVVPYSLQDNVLALGASFNNARSIAITAAFSTSGDVVTGVLKVDGGFAEACFEIPGQSPSCAPDGAQTQDTNAQQGTDNPPALQPITINNPISLFGSDSPKNGGDPSRLSSPPPTGAGSIPAALGEDPYAEYCVIIDGRPACKAPIMADGMPLDPMTNPSKPSLSQMDEQISLSPGMIRALLPETQPSGGESP